MGCCCDEGGYGDSLATDRCIPHGGSLFRPKAQRVSDTKVALEHDTLPASANRAGARAAGRAPPPATASGHATACCPSPRPAAVQQVSILVS